MVKLEIQSVVRMSREMHAAIHDRAEVEDRSAAWIIRKAVEEYLAARRVSGGTPDGWERALETVATMRQEADDFDHPDFDWRMLARKMEKVARDALH